MPQTKTVYKWNNYNLEIELIVGTELLFKDMTIEDNEIYFVYKKVNNELKLIKQFNIAGEGILESEFEEKNLLTPYFEKKY